MTDDIYRVFVGELGGANDQIQESITDMHVSLTTDMTSEVRFTVNDPDFKMHNAGYFVMRRPVYYRELFFEIATVSPSKRTGRPEQVEISARGSQAQQLKRAKGAADFGKISPSAFAAQAARGADMGIFAEGSPAKAAIVRQNTEESSESTWDVLSRLAGELDFVMFDSDRMLYFASEEFIIKNQVGFELNYPSDENDPFYIYDFEFTRSDDEVLGADLSVSIARDNGVNIRPGMAVTFNGLEYFKDPMMVTSVEWDTAVVDQGLGEAVLEPVQVKARTPKESDDTGCETKTFKKGARGDCVKRLQQAVGATADGIFGPLTEAAVARFQEANGLEPDGIVGVSTWAAFT